MALWIILVMGWLAVLLLGLSLVRIAGYTEKKVRNLAQRPRGRNDQAASGLLQTPMLRKEVFSAQRAEEDKKIA